MRKHMYPTHCDDCNELFAYMDSHPRGYMVFLSCGEKAESERFAEQDEEFKGSEHAE